MQLQVAKWGNSLAVRLPANCVRAAGLREGDMVEAEFNAAGAITLTPARAFDRTAFLARLESLQADMPEGAPVLEELRQGARY